MTESLNVFSSDPKHLNDREYFYQEQWLRKIKKLHGMRYSSFQVRILLLLLFFGRGGEKRSLASLKKLPR